MDKVSFTASWKTLGFLNETNTFFKEEKWLQDHVIKNEPMLFSASREAALKEQSIITKAFIEQYLDPKENWIIDSRVHMLMEGWWPCIPGFHNDDIPRGGEYSQPYWNGMDIEYRADHILMVAGPVSMTEFISPGETFELSNPIGKEALYNDWNKEIKEQIQQEKIKTEKINSFQVIQFSEPDFHQGVASEGNGWRYFIRASKNTPRKFSEDPLRRQVQVYMEMPEKGW